MESRVIRTLIRLFAWIGVIMLYYIGFSFLFDTPHEYQMRHTTEQMQQHYDQMVERYDSLEQVLENITARDKGVFRILFESDPYDLDTEQSEERLALHEQNIAKSRSELHADMNQRISKLENRMKDIEQAWQQTISRGQEMGKKSHNIPSIQPVINKQLTLLTAGYGTILNPFYRTLKSHQGVDYTVAEGSSIFATADGKVKEISDKNSTLGKTVVIDHGNGYQTSYSHLLSVLVRKGQTVQRGDIIALSGNSGLSLAPHLHYEVRYNGIRIDPIHYFFMELTPDEYQRIIRIAQSGMQSFD
ncbi:MAG: M23 family metallopeptidase [Alistipes sp.]|nr:M23 family metallopeptidase [Alistipes sp.]